MSARGQNEKPPFSGLCQLSLAADMRPHWLWSESCRFFCKSLFAQVIKNSPGFKRDFLVEMWGTCPDEKLTGDLGSVIEATRIDGRWSDRFMAGKSSPGNFGLLQQNLPRADLMHCSKSILTRVARRALTRPPLAEPYRISSASDGSLASASRNRRRQVCWTAVSFPSRASRSRIASASCNVARARGGSETVLIL